MIGEDLAMADGSVLAIDQGTTGTTVMIFDHGGTVRARAYAEFTQHYPRPGWVEHDAEEIWSITQDVIRTALQSSGRTVDRIVAVGITNQRETAVIWDRASGRPVSRAIVWQDRRTADACEALKAKGFEETIHRKTGLVLDPYFSATKIQWLLQHVDGLKSRAVRGELAFGTVDSWLVWNLTGGRVHVTDVSNASRTLLFNIHELRWDRDLLKIFDIPAALLPQVQPSSHVYGLTDPQTVFGAHAVPVAGIAGDQQAALFGQACFVEGRAKNTYGTGSFLLMNTGTTPKPSAANLLTTVAWQVGDGPVEYALEGAIFVTGAAVQWLRDKLGLIKNAAETESLASSLTSNDNVYFVPALTGLGAPYWDPYARGALLGATRGTTRAHLARAVLESIAYQTRDIVEAMQADSGIVLRELRCDGGASANGFLMQFQSDILGVPVDVPKISETTALGAAYFAGLAVGFWQSRDQIDAHWRLERRYEPSLGEKERDRLYGRWRKAVDRARGWARDEEN